MALSVACAQFSPEKGNLSANLDKIAQTISQAAEESVQLMLFPESCVSGYYLEGGVASFAISIEELTSELSFRLNGLKKDLDFSLGFYEMFGNTVYNSAAYFEYSSGQLKPIARHRKIFLPTYGMFDEERFLTAGQEMTVFDTRHGKMGLLICEDIWHSILPTLCAARGAQMILVPSASPGRGFSGDKIGNLERYRQMETAISQEHSVFTMNAQLCGFEGGKGLVGGSSIVNPFGKVVAESPILEEHLLVAEIDLEEVSIARAQTPLLPDLISRGDLIKRLVCESFE